MTVTFDCFDSAVLGLSIGANMQAILCVDILNDTMMEAHNTPAIFIVTLSLNIMLFKV